MGSDTASAVPEFSGGRGAGFGGQTYRDDITGAALDPELAAPARSEEIRFMESWRVGRPAGLRAHSPRWQEAHRREM
eukprot:4101526-Alexandrium_andersonii.AAC.1